MLRKTVPDPYSSDWKSSVAVGWESGMGKRQEHRDTQADSIMPNILYYKIM